MPIFQALSKVQKEALLAVLNYEEFNIGNKVVSEGEPGNLFYFIKDGIVKCTIKGKMVRQMSKGEYFGEQALLYNTVRTATIQVVTKATLLSIGREDLSRVLGSQLINIIYQNSMRIALESSPSLRTLTKDQINLIISKVKFVSYKEGNVVISKNIKRGQKFWIILKGTLVTDTRGHKFMPLECIGDSDLEAPSSDKFPENIVAEGAVDTAEMTRQELENLIGGQLNRVNSKNEILSIMRNVRLLKALPKKNLESLVNKVFIQEFQNNEVIFRENAKGDAFYIVKDGKVDIIKDGLVLRTIGRHDYFGERSIILKDTRTATARSNGCTQTWILNADDFLTLVNENIRIMLLKRIELQDDSIALKDLSIAKLLGKGMFGNVFMAVNKMTGLPYAIKTVHRNKIRAYDLYSSLILERHVLLQIDHPMIMKLVKTFKDPDRVYFLMEFVPGKDLFDVLRELRSMNDATVKFYTCCLLEILDHIHEREILYRDLKPENIMIDQEGFPKLIDFGTAKIVQGRTYTVVGTPHYMAPEVISGKGYGFSADYWCLGVIIYEFICSKLPFGSEDEDPYAVYEKILKNRLGYPQGINKSSKAIPIIEFLLDKNPANRANIEVIKQHNYFEGVNWDNVLSKQLKVPYMPRVANYADDIARAMQSKRSVTAFIAVNFI